MVAVASDFGSFLTKNSKTQNLKNQVFCFSNCVTQSLRIFVWHIEFIMED